jgi:hypothetical protein
VAEYKPFWFDPNPRRRLIRRTIGWCLVGGGVAIVAAILGSFLESGVVYASLAIVATVVGGAAAVIGCIAVLLAIIDMLFA